jgi:hypothetical protein
MSEPTVSDLRNAFEITSQVADSRLSFCLDGALRRVKTKIGATHYAEVFSGATSTLPDNYNTVAVAAIPDDSLGTVQSPGNYVGADSDTTSTNETATRLAEVTDAALYYAMASVLINTNLRIRSGGQIKKEQDAGSPAMGAGNQINNEYLAPKEVSEWRMSLIAEADRMLAPYAVTQPPPNPTSASKIVRA